MTTIEHCTWMRHGGGGFDQRDGVARQMAAQGIYACWAWPPDWRIFMKRLGPERSELLAARFRWLDDLGVRLIPGTDAGLPNSGFTDYVSALELYEHLGFSRDRIIEMATVTSAAALGLTGETGQLAHGHSADLLVVDGDPLTGLNALHNRKLILFHGKDVP